MVKNDLLSEQSIKNILTLRYNPESKPFYPDKTHYDYYEEDLPWENIVVAKLEGELIKLSKYDKIGISLSGGVDSVLLLSMINKLLPEKKLITINDVSSGEREQAEYIARRIYDTHFISIRTDNIIPEIPFYVKLTGEPRTNVYHHHVWRVAKESGCDVLVTGDGGDELFGGYTFRYHKFNNYMVEGTKDPAIIYQWCHINDFAEDNRLLTGEWPSDIAKKYFIPQSGDMRDVLRWDYNGKLNRDLLPTSHKISEYYKVPTFAPFLELRDVASHIPVDQLFNNDYSVGKIILRRIAIYYDSPITLGKKGYTRNIIDDFERGSKPIMDVLSNKEDPIYKIVNKEWVDRNIQNYKDIRVCNKLLQLYSLHHYLKHES